ncbi:MAG: C45 family autoproteolytic acyltransferase/hydrolase [Methanotrichaceae archaeon]
MSTRALLVISMVILAAFLAVSTVYAEKAVDSVNSAALLSNPAIVKDEIIIPMENGTMMEWRHIVLKGNNTQIGMALGEIAQKDYGVTSLKKYADPIYGKARQEYMARNYPTMRDRMKGIAMSYGLSQDNATFDTTTLPYDVGSLACSMVYFPPETTLNGHAITSRNMEWYLVPIDVYLGKIDKGTGKSMFTRNFLIEIYPDHGYSTMAIAGMDLNSVIDGLNSEGLGISALEDEGMEPALEMPMAGDRNSGIMGSQITRLVLETCRTVEEAKVAFLANKEFLPIGAFHYMVYDSQGNSAIVEWNKSDGNLYFTDGNGNKPNIMTNHPMYIYSKYGLEDLSEEKNLIMYDDPYDTFNRYITLYNIISSHDGKFSDEDAANVLSSVEGNTVIQAEGAMKPLPINTIWNVILDLTDRSMKVKFFLKKGPVDKATNKSTLIFTPYLAFKMNNSSMQQ